MASDEMQDDVDYLGIFVGDSEAQQVEASDAMQDDVDYLDLGSLVCHSEEQQVDMNMNAGVVEGQQSEDIDVAIFAGHLQQPDMQNNVIDYQGLVADESELPLAQDVVGADLPVLGECAVVPCSRRKRRTKAEMIAARAEPERETRFGRVKQRTKSQQVASCAHARSVRAQKALERIRDDVHNYAKDLSLALHTSSGLRDGHRLEVLPTSARNLPKFQQQLLCVRRHLNRVKFNRSMSAQTIVVMSQSPLNACKDVAKVYRCSAWQVRAARKVTAWCILNAQKQLTESVETRPLRFLVSSLAFDETSEKLDLDLSGLKQNLKLTWKILVSLQELIAQHDGQQNVFRINAIRPPVPLMSNRAEQMFYGLWSAKVVQSLTKVFEHGLRRAEVAAILHTDRDACASNDRLVAHRHVSLAERTETGGVVLASDLQCCNHQNQLIETAVCDLFGLDLIGSVYRAALLFRMGSYWLRILQAVEPVIDKHLEIVVRNDGEAPDALISAYNIEWVSYLRATYRQTELASGKIKGRSAARGQKDPDPDDDGQMGCGEQECEAWRRTKGGRAWSADWDNLLSLLPTPWYEERCVHVCRGERPDRGGLVKKVTHAVRMVLFRSLPCVPCAGKWTRTGPAVDAILTSMVVHAMLPRVLKVAFSQNLAEEQPRGSPVEEQSYLEEVQWHAVASKRARLTQTFVGDDHKKSTMMIFSLIKEPLRHLTARFLRAAARAKRQTDVEGRPRLAEFTDARFSPITLVQQYFSAMLHGNCSRLILICRGDSVGAWKRSQPREASMLRRGCLLAASSLHRRFGSLQEFPWRLCSLVDPRCSQSDRLAIVEEFANVAACRLDPMFSRRLQSAIAGDPLQLLRHPWADVIRSWAISARIVMWFLIPRAGRSVIVATYLEITLAATLMDNNSFPCLLLLLIPSPALRPRDAC